MTFGSQGTLCRGMLDWIKMIGGHFSENYLFLERENSIYFDGEPKQKTIMRRKVSVDSYFVQ